ncbi:MAG: hypothetical protein R2834_04645 [Rhodothermales bacterium]
MRHPLTYIALFVLVLAGCEKDDPVGPDPNNQTATFTDIQNTIFTTSCALSGCHAGASPQQGMNLSAGQAYANIVNVPSNENPQMNRITPNDPDNSYLFLKISGTNISGSRMPLGGSPLSDDKIAMVREWIEDGAPNN